MVAFDVKNKTKKGVFDFFFPFPSPIPFVPSFPCNTFEAEKEQLNNSSSTL